MHKSAVSVLTLISLLFLLSACGLLQDPPTPSAPLEAVPLEPTAEGAAETDSPEATAVATEAATATAEPVPTTTEESSEAATPTAEAETASGERRIYTITPGESQVRFELDEDLRGQRTTVVGISDQVAGEIGFNAAALSDAQIGVIQINARTLSTDNNFRNRAIHNEILDTGAFEFITFTPTAIEGLPATAAIGDEVAFTVAGELTIRDVTQPVTFEVVATPTSAEEVAGTARATVSREAFGLRIPDVPSVANVEDEVDLTINFVAVGA